MREMLIKQVITFSFFEKGIITDFEEWFDQNAKQNVDVSLESFNNHFEQFFADINHDINEEAEHVNSNNDLNELNSSY